MATSFEDLTKKELTTEAYMRGIEVAEDWTVQQLQVALKSTANPVDYSLYFSQVTVSSEITNLQVAKGILEEYFQKVSEDFTIHRYRRLHARLRHYIFRVQELMKQVPDGEQVKNLQEIFNTFSEYQSKLSQMKQKQPVVQVPVQAYDLENLDSVSPPVSVVHDRSDIVRPLENLNLQQSLAQNFSRNVSHSTPSTPSFQFEILKLPNPIMEILKGINTLSVINYDCILQFLDILVKIKKQAGRLKIPDNDILQILYTFCSGILTEFVNQSITKGSSLSHFHSEFLQTYLPLTLLNRFITQLVLRPQNTNEPFETYIQDIKFHSEMFQCNYSEAQLVELLVMNSSSPEIRGLFLNSAPPKTFEDLFIVANKFSQCQTGDFLRSAPAAPPFWRSNASHAGFNSPLPSSKPAVVCFYCKKPGHVIRDCRKRKRLQPEQSAQ